MNGSRHQLAAPHSPHPAPMSPSPPFDWLGGGEQEGSCLPPVDGQDQVAATKNAPLSWMAPKAENRARYRQRVPAKGVTDVIGRFRSLPVRTGHPGCADNDSLLERLNLSRLRKEGHPLSPPTPLPQKASQRWCSGDSPHLNFGKKPHGGGSSLDRKSSTDRTLRYFSSRFRAWATQCAKGEGRSHGGPCCTPLRL